MKCAPSWSAAAGRRRRWWRDENGCGLPAMAPDEPHPNTPGAA